MKNVMCVMSQKTSKSLMSLAMLLCSFSLLLSSCDKGVPEITSGDPVVISFSVNGDSFGAAEEITRSSETVEPETVVVPVEGGWYMYATLEPDASDTRATNGGANALVAGTEVRILAYLNDGASPAAQAVYTVDPGGTTLSSASPLTVAPGNYTFVAYAKQNSTLSGLGALATLDPATHDLLWGKADNAGSPITVTASTTININISHLCSRIKAVITNTDGTTAYAMLTPAGTMDGYTIDLSTGKPVKNTPATAYPLAGWVGSGASSNRIWTSNDQCLIYTDGEAAKMNLTNININGTAITPNPILTFTKPLQKNTPYTLTVTFKRIAWAGSNIYWDSANNRLTFDVLHTTTDVYGVTVTPNQMKQGVFFMFGSLVGISPVGGWAVGTNGTPSTGTALYVPTISGTSATAWTQTNAATVIGPPVNKPAWTWTTIPYITTGTGTDRTVHHVQTEHTATNIAAFKGDVCTLINSAWRLPVSQEFGGVGTASYAWGTGPTQALAQGWSHNGGLFPTTETTSSPFGIDTNLSTAAIYLNLLYYPASGYRLATTGSLNFVGQRGLYWSGSDNDASGYGLLLNSSLLAPSNSASRRAGLAVRCVYDPPVPAIIDTGITSDTWGTGDTGGEDKWVNW